MTPAHLSLQAELLQLLTPEQAWHYHIIPKTVASGSMAFYADEAHNNASLIEELEVLFEKKISLEFLASGVILKTLGTHYRREQKLSGSAQNIEMKRQPDDFLHSLIAEARRLRSSDIHLEPYKECCRVRIRIDGQLAERYVVSQEDYPGLINKIKILAHLDISEKRLPQDGRIFFQAGPEKFDIRVSALPTLHGEKIVLRLLGQDAASIDIQTLGFVPADLANYLQAVGKPNGMVLISGPTGSGKTTTLYATLRLLNSTSRNILTIEDPVEYTLEGINQVQLKESIGLNFASALRTFLRQDPDIIMLGEIRDGETAAMAVRAALTGHLVLSTIHTNSAWGTVSRLIDMGVPPFLVANTLNISVAQRLVRLLCPHCKIQQAFIPEEYQLLSFLKQLGIGSLPLHHYLPVGCDRCYYTGYQGRKAVFEVIPIDAELSEKARFADTNVSEVLRSKGIKRFSENAFALFAAGDTSLEEVTPVLMIS